MKRVTQTQEGRYTYDRLFPLRRPPQGMTEEQFRLVAVTLRRRLAEVAARFGDLGDDLFVHGSRARETAEPDADLDIGIRVSAEFFDELLRARVARVRQGGDAWKTLQEAARQGRLHAGEVGISGVRKEIQRLVNEHLDLGLLKGVQITVIRERGRFDQGPFIELPR